MEEIENCTVGNLLNELKPSPFSSWYCPEDIMEQLKKLDKSTMIRVYGCSSFRLADEYPSFYVKYVIICE